MTKTANNNTNNIFASTAKTAINTILATLDNPNHIDTFDLFLNLCHIKDSFSPSEVFSFEALSFEGLFKIVNIFLVIQRTFDYNLPQWVKSEMEDALKEVLATARFLCRRLQREKAKTLSLLMKAHVYDFLCNWWSDIGCLIDNLPYPNNWDEDINESYKALNDTIHWLTKYHFN